MTLAQTKRDYYETLGVQRDADDAALKRAFRKLARQYHPDVNSEPGAEDRFKEISEAYEVLNDPQKRHSITSTVMPVSTAVQGTLAISADSDRSPTFSSNLATSLAEPAPRRGGMARNEGPIYAMT